VLVRRLRCPASGVAPFVPAPGAPRVIGLPGSVPRVLVELVGETRAIRFGTCVGSSRKCEARFDQADTPAPWRAQESVGDVLETCRPRPAEVTSWPVTRSAAPKSSVAARRPEVRQQ